MMRRLGIPFALMALLGACYPNAQPEPAMVPQKERRTDADRATGEYLITVHPGSSTVSILEGFETFGFRELRKISTNLFLLKVDRDPSPEVMQQRGRQIEAIKSIEPNYIYRTQ